MGKEVSVHMYLCILCLYPCLYVYVYNVCIYLCRVCCIIAHVDLKCQLKNFEALVFQRTEISEISLCVGKQEPRSFQRVVAE